jgi:hypothetical protein
MPNSGAKKLKCEMRVRLAVNGAVKKLLEKRDS